MCAENNFDRNYRRNYNMYIHFTITIIAGRTSARERL